MSTVLMVITMGSYFDVDIVFHLSPRGMNSLMPSVYYVMTVCLKGMYHNGLSLLIKSYFSISLSLACVCVCVDAKSLNCQNLQDVNTIYDILQTHHQCHLLLLILACAV